MDSLFLLQFGCCLATTMMALLLALSRLHIHHFSRSYEVARWSLFLSMLLFACQYMLQMLHSYRAEGADAGTVVNILFYTPSVALISYATLRLAGTRTYIKRYTIAAAISMSCVLGCFLAGWITYRSLHMHYALYGMGAAFTLSVLHFALSPMREIARISRQVENNTASDLSAYFTYMRTGVAMLFVFGVLMSLGIFSTDVLLYTGPLFMLVLFFYIICFVSLGSHMSAINDVLEDSFNTEEEETTAAAEPAEAQQPSTRLSDERVAEIGQMMEQWMQERGFADSNLNLSSLSRRLGVSQKEFTQYLLQTKGLTFRIWLSDIRVEEVKRMLLEQPDLSIEGIAQECGFSSRSWFRQKFKAVTGMTPAEYKEANDRR